MVNPYDKMVAESNAALAHARREVLLAQAHLDAVKSHRERIKDADVEAKAQAMAASGSESTTAKQKLIDTARAGVGRVGRTWSQPSWPPGAPSRDRGDQQRTGQP